MDEIPGGRATKFSHDSVDGAMMDDQGMTNVADVLTRHARERPWAVAIIENDEVIHYQKLERLVWAAAWHLRQLGIGPGDVVGLALPHSAFYLVAVYALARLGAVSTPLPLNDPASLRESFARRFAVNRILASSDAAAVAGIPTVTLAMDRLKQVPATMPADLRSVGGDQAWIIRRTSGTTSEAKGIAITHRALLAEFGCQTALFPGPRDRLLAVIPMSMTYGLHICKRTLYSGGTIVVAPDRLRPEKMLDLIDRYAITWCNLTTNIFDLLLPLLPAEACRSPSLIGAIASGMAMPEGLRADIRRRFSRGLSIRYGSNEGGYLTAADAGMQENHPETVGCALPGVELEIVDDGDRPVPAGEPGNIRARTPWMPTGYVNAPEAANRTFRNGWVYLGDVGVLSVEGMLFIRGRSDDMMNFDGIKIMPADIEEALLAHPAVAEAVAFPVASGRHQHLPSAVVVLRHPASIDELLAHCRQRLGPRAPLAIGIETALPRNAMGKVVRRLLADRMAANLPARLR